MWVVTYIEGTYGDRNHSEFDTKEEALDFIRSEIVSVDYNSFRVYARVPVEITVIL
jgi:hypothetical protein